MFVPPLNRTPFDPTRNLNSKLETMSMTTQGEMKGMRMGKDLCLPMGGIMTE